MKFLFQWICSSGQMTLHFNFNSPSIGCMKSSRYKILILYLITQLKICSSRTLAFAIIFSPQCLIPTLLPYLPRVMKDIIHLKTKERVDFTSKQRSCSSLTCCSWGSFDPANSIFNSCCWYLWSCSTCSWPYITWKINCYFLFNTFQKILPSGLGAYYENYQN